MLLPRPEAETVSSPERSGASSRRAEGVLWQTWTTGRVVREGFLEGDGRGRKYCRIRAAFGL
jgi:hypothetical protein